MKLSVVIPVYNEEATLEKIVRKVQNVDIDKEIIMVDDGSFDGSKQIEDKLVKRYRNIKVYRQKKNQGKGAALRVGFSKATGDYVIVQDADLEYDPQDYYKLLKEIKKKDVDIVYGSRFLGKMDKMSFTHKWGNKFLTFITNVLYKVRLTDMETCYKLFPAKIIQSIKFNSNRFNFEPEITAKVLKKGCRIVEVPIKYQGRGRQEGKKINWKDGFAAVWALTKYRFVN